MHGLFKSMKVGITILLIKAQGMAWKRPIKERMEKLILGNKT